MIESFRRNTTLIVGITLCSAILLMVRPFAVSPRGTAGPTMLQASSGVIALVAFVVLLALATVVAIVVARLVNAAVGLFVLGSGLFVVGLRLSTVEELAFSGGSVTVQAVETVLLAALLLPAVLAVFRFGGPFEDVHPREAGAAPEAWCGPGAMKGAVAGLLMLPAVWLIARSHMNGQVFAAACVGGTAAGLIGRLVNPHVQPILLFITPVLAGAIGYGIVVAKTGSSIEAAFVDGSISAFARVRPIDYAAGSLTGVAMGLGWARSFLVHEDR